MDDDKHVLLQVAWRDFCMFLLIPSRKRRGKRRTEIRQRRIRPISSSFLLLTMAVIIADVAFV